MKILVTGASGYIGRHIVRQLLNAGHDIIAADRTVIDFGESESRVAYTKVPIFSGSPHIYEELGSPDVCIHLAWRNGFKHDDDSHLEDVSKHYVFIRDMIKGGLPQFVGMGTVHEIGYWEGAVNEDTPNHPQSYYGVAKNCVREFSELLASKNGAIFQWIRAYYITGDDRNSCSVFNKILLANDAHDKYFPFTSGKNEHDFIDIDDLARQISHVAGQTKVTGIINCCSGSPMPIGERVEKFISDNALSIKLKYGAFPDRAYDSPAVWGDATKIRLIMEKESLGD